MTLLLSDFSFPAAPKVADTEDEKIWTKILEDVSSESNKVSQGCAIALGDPLCGKTSLVTRMVGADRTPNPSVFEYNFLTVHANEDNRQAYQLTSSAALFGSHDSMNLPLWIADGSYSCKDLFEFAFPKQLTKLVIILCASVDEPSKVLENLKRWYQIVDAGVREHYSEEAVKEAKTAQMRFWQEYVEPAESMYVDASELKNDLLEPELGVLTESCGASIIVALTKTDEKPFTSSDALSRLQYELRQFCLNHGAALFYTSAKSDTNTALLRKYVAHRVYGVPFTKPAHIVDESSIFIPSGWDSLKKLDAERDSLPPDSGRDSNADDAALISSSRDRLAECKDEQNFLGELAKILSESPATPARTNEPSLGAVAALATPAAAPAAAATQSPLASYFGSLIKSPPTKPTSALANADAAAHFQKLASNAKTPVKEKGDEN